MERPVGSVRVFFDVAPCACKAVLLGLNGKRLRADAEAGQTLRAAYWDYLSVLIDWLMNFAVFALSDGYAMRLPFVWLCVAGTYTVPTVFVRRDLGYNWGNYVF